MGHTLLLPPKQPERGDERDHNAEKRHNELHRHEEGGGNHKGEHHEHTNGNEGRKRASGHHTENVKNGLRFNRSSRGSLPLGVRACVSRLINRNRYVVTVNRDRDPLVVRGLDRYRAGINASIYFAIHFWAGRLPRRICPDNLGLLTQADQR